MEHSVLDRGRCLIGTRIDAMCGMIRFGLYEAVVVTAVDVVRWNDIVGAVVVCLASIRVESVTDGCGLRHGVACLGTTPPTCAGGV